MAIDRKSLVPFSSKKAPAQFNPAGTWTNELGSTMQITSVSGNTFSGIYTSAVSSTGQTAQGPVAGTIAGDAIGFTVNWSSDFSSVTSWSGLVLTSGSAEFLYTLWHLASTPESPDEAWESILAGADIFFQTNP